MSVSSTAPWDEHLPKGADAPPRYTVELDRDRALELLASAPYGRVVFTRDALPAVRPVNHIVVDGLIVIRTRLTARFSHAVRTAPAVVVAYQADDIDPAQHTGWSVVVTGFARTVTDPVEVQRYTGLLRPWVDSVLDTLVTIEPTLVTGVQLIPAAESTGPDSMSVA